MFGLNRNAVSPIVFFLVSCGAMFAGYNYYIVPMCAVSIVVNTYMKLTNVRPHNGVANATYTTLWVHFAIVNFFLATQVAYRTATGLLF